MLQLRCRCGPVRPHLVAVTDAGRSERLDPTGTSRIRNRLKRELDARWARVRRASVAVIDRNDSMGLSSSIESGAMRVGSDAVSAFSSWFEQTALQHVIGYNGSWMHQYVDEASAAARARASKLTGRIAPPDPRRVQVLRALPIAELQGVVDATQQQAVRALGAALLSGQRPSQAARAVGAAINAIGVKRSRMVGDFVVVKTFSSMTLDAFRAAGVPSVGTVPERVPVMRAPHLTPLKRDEAPRRTHFLRDVSQRTIRSREAAVQQLGEVDVLTAGDDLVCEECQDISEGGPYDIDAAEGLIPAHINCRCAFVPTSDERFAAVGEEDDLGDSVQDYNPNHDPHSGEFSSGDGSPTAAAWAKEGDAAGLTSRHDGAPFTVYHGLKKGHSSEGFMFVTRSESGAASHGKVSAYTVPTGARIYADIESGKTKTGRQTLIEASKESSSGIIHSSDLIPKVRRTRDYNPNHLGAGPGGGQFAAAEGLGGGGGSSESSSSVDKPKFKTSRKLTEAESEAVMSYRNDDYRKINAALRGDAKSTKEIDAKADLIRSAIDTSETANDTRVFRGVNINEELTKNPSNVKDLIGKSIRVKGFQSTSVGEKAAKNFSGAVTSDKYFNENGSPFKGDKVGYAHHSETEEVDTILEIALPRGTPALRPGNAGRNAMGPSAREGEVILKPGTYRVTGVEKSESTKVTNERSGLKSTTRSIKIRIKATYTPSSTKDSALDYNPNHLGAGPGGGQFAAAEGVGSGGGEESFTSTLTSGEVGGRGSELSVDEETALKGYGHLEHGRINKSMRHVAETGEESKYVKKIALIKSAIEKSQLQSDATLYRGVGGRTGNRLAKPGAAEKLIGANLPALGFQSTSRSIAQSRRFADHFAPVLMKISAEKGTPALDMRHYGPAIEKEMLLNPGSYRVDKVTRGYKDNKNGVIIHVTYRSEPRHV